MGLSALIQDHGHTELGSRVILSTPGCQKWCAKYGGTKARPPGPLLVGEAGMACAGETRCMPRPSVTTAGCLPLPAPASLSAQIESHWLTCRGNRPSNCKDACTPHPFVPFTYHLYEIEQDTHQMLQPLSGSSDPHQKFGDPIICIERGKTTTLAHYSKMRHTSAERNFSTPPSASWCIRAAPNSPIRKEWG